MIPKYIEVELITGVRCLSCTNNRKDLCLVAQIFCLDSDITAYAKNFLEDSAERTRT